MSSRSSPEDAAAPSPSQLAVHLDLVGGLAGDMFVAALVDALPRLEAPVLAELAAAQPASADTPRFGEVTSGGLRARRLALAPRADGAAHAHGGGTSYAQVQQRLAEAPLAAATREHALALLALLGEAEAHVHGIALADVHFHELADWDSLLDLVAAGCICARLQGAQWSASALPLGGGSVATAHGMLPVPAPATSYLLTGYSWRHDGVGGERVTPTGAAILRHLVAAAACDGAREEGRLVGVGCGAGTRTLPGVPNVTRALVFERTRLAETDRVALLEFDVDDMTGEEIALAADRLRMQAGVLDVSVGSRVGKKGRPLADFRVLVQPHVVDAIALVCFAETSTLGLRVREERRLVLPRSETTGAGAGTGTRVKIAQRPGGERTAKAAHDDLTQAGGLAARRAARAESEQHALGGGDE